MNQNLRTPLSKVGLPNGNYSLQFAVKKSSSKPIRFHTGFTRMEDIKNGTLDMTRSGQTLGEFEESVTSAEQI